MKKFLLAAAAFAVFGVGAAQAFPGAPSSTQGRYIVPSSIGSHCALHVDQFSGSPRLIATAAPGLIGDWSLSVRSPSLVADQSGPVHTRSQAAALSTMVLSGGPQRFMRSAFGFNNGIRRVPVQSGPIFASLTVRDVDGFVICREQLRYTPADHL